MNEDDDDKPPQKMPFQVRIAREQEGAATHVVSFDLGEALQWGWALTKALVHAEARAKGKQLRAKIKQQPRAKARQRRKA